MQAYIRQRGDKKALVFKGAEEEMLALGVILPYTGIGRDMSFTPLPVVYYYWLTAILLPYCPLNQFVKQWYIKRYKSWI